MTRDTTEERTVLAWQRFALSLAVVGALALRAGLAHPALGSFVAALVCSIAAFLQLVGPRLAGPVAVRVGLAATLVAAAGALALAVA